jgi:pyridoxal phosphate enzyme (YggS family)
VNAVQARIQAVRERIEQACAHAGRSPDSVTLVAVSKTFSADAVEAAARAGQHHFGENYVQEALTKMDAIKRSALVWHFIGPIQSNKTRPIAEHFQWVHSVDRLKVAERLSQQRSASAPPLDVCVQVNVSDESSKSGVRPAALADLAVAVAGLPKLRLRGLMTVPEPTGDEALQRRRFGELRGLKEALCSQGLELDTLSMGMSADLEAAIAEGATMVRIGTAIFGTRSAAKRDA